MSAPATGDGQPGASGASPLSYSVVIPAYNERGVIGRLLSGLTQSDDGNDVEIIVSCNGCTDDTADVARTYGVTVLETAVASKSVALNAGDRAARRLPRFYVDADVIVTRETLNMLARDLVEEQVLAVMPRTKVNLRGRPLSVRAYYRIWEQLPYNQEHRLAAVIGVSPRGRARFEAFPDAFADDRFLQKQFEAHERRIDLRSHYLVDAPLRLGDLVRIRTRIDVGNRLLDEITGNSSTTKPRDLARLLARRPWDLPAAVIYLGVAFRAKAVARQRIRAGTADRWDRDEASRLPG